MKYLKLAYFIPLFYSALSWGPPPQSIPAEIDYSEDLVESYLNVLGRRIDPTDLVACRDSLNNATVLSCREKKSSVEHALVTATLMIRKIKRSLAKEIPIRKTKREKQILSEVTKVISCMEQKLADEVYMECGPCSTSATNVAQTKITVLTRSIELCPEFHRFNRNIDKAHILVHEISHLCGTVDQRYMGISDEGSHGPLIRQMRRPVAYRTEKTYGIGGFNLFRTESFDAHQNADNYAYWARFGFCFPGECGRRRR